MGSKRIEKPTKPESSVKNRDAVKEKLDNVTVSTSSKKVVTVMATKKVSNSHNASTKPQISSKTVISKPKPAETTASTMKPKISSTTTNNRQQPIRAIHLIQARKPVAEKNVMNTVHSVTVASPPPVRREYTNIQQSMEELPKPLEQVHTQQSMEALPRARTRTRTLGPEEALILKQSKGEQRANNLQDANSVVSKIVQKPLKVQEPVAYEITFDKPVSNTTPDNSSETPSAMLQEARQFEEARQSEEVRQSEEAHQSKEAHQPEETQQSDEAEYDDDFDSYESDFEAESSSASQTASTTSSKSEDESVTSVPTPSMNSPISPIAKKIDDDRDFDSGTFELKGSAERVQLDSIDERELHSEGQTDSGFG